MADRALQALDWLLHHRRYDLIPADIINAETGSMDDYCTCWLCKRLSRG